MEMFNEKVAKERIGDLKKNKVLNVLEQVEKLYLKKIRKFRTETSYDVTAQELPRFKTLNYTEYATCFITEPLNLEMRVRQMEHAFKDDDKNYETLDWCGYFAENINKKIANKYEDRDQELSKYKDVDNLVVLAGSNKLKERTCLNKLKAISDKHGDNLYFKPHPVTTHAIIGEMKDMFGEHRILPREVDVYYFLGKATKVYTTHMSETALYGTVLDKEIEPTDVYHKVHQGSFYHINKFLFESQIFDYDGKEWVNKVFSSQKSGIINPNVDTNWKKKLDDYFSYIHDERERYAGWYVEGKPVKKTVDGKLISKKK